MTGQYSEKEAFFVAIDVAPFIFLIFSISIIAFGFVFQRKQWRQAQAKIEGKAQKVQEILLERIMLQSHLLKEFSTELHNNPGQLLFVAKINLNILEEQEQADENLPYIKNTNDLLTQTINELRGLIKRMDEEAAYRIGLMPWIRYELEKIRKTNLTDTTLTVKGEPRRLSDEREIILFSIVQDILKLAQKQIKTQEIKLIAQFEPKVFSLTIDIETRQQHSFQVSESGINEAANLIETAIPAIIARCKLIDFSCRIDSGTEFKYTVYLSAGL